MLFILRSEGPRIFRASSLLHRITYNARGRGKAITTSLEDNLPDSHRGKQIAPAHLS